jgi:hypothetical protein
MVRDIRDCYDYAPIDPEPIYMLNMVRINGGTDPDDDEPAAAFVHEVHLTHAVTHTYPQGEALTLVGVTATGVPVLVGPALAPPRPTYRHPESYYTPWGVDDTAYAPRGERPPPAPPGATDIDVLCGCGEVPSWHMPNMPIPP